MSATVGSPVTAIVTDAGAKVVEVDPVDPVEAVPDEVGDDDEALLLDPQADATTAVAINGIVNAFIRLVPLRAITELPLEWAR